MNDLELEREIRDTFRRHGVDVLDPELVPPVREVVRLTRHRQLTTALTAVAVGVALVAASVAGITAVIRSSERRTPAEPPKPVPSGTLGAPAAQPVSFEGIVADTDGNLWSTIPALTRFDPATGTLRTFTIADDPTFSASSVAPAREGGVWVTSAWYAGGAAVVRRFDGERFVDTSPPAPGYLGEIAEGPDGTVWASGAGVYSWDGSAWLPAPTEGRPTTDAGPIAVDASGNVWVGNLRYPGPKWFGVSRFDGTSWTTYSERDLFGGLSDGPDAGAIWAIVPGPAGDVWVGGSGSVTHFVDGIWTAYPSADLGIGNVMSIAVTDTDVWIGGESVRTGGPPVARFDGTAWVPVQEGLEEAHAPGGLEYTQVVASPEGVLAVTNAGLFRLEDPRWERVAVDERPRGVGLTLAGAGADELWMGDWTGLGGVWRLQGDDWTHFDLVPNASGGPRALLVAEDGTAWAATDKGLWSFDGERWDEVAPGPHTAIALGPPGEVWAAKGGGLDGATLGQVGGAELPGTVPVQGDVTSLAIGPAGDVWAGSAGVWGMGGGVARFDGERWVKMEPVPGEEAFLVQDVAATPDGDVWVTAHVPGPGTGGEEVLVRYHDGAWTTFGEAAGVPADETGWSRELEVTSDGRLLLATPVGLFEFRDGAWVRVEEGAFFSQTPWAHTFSIAPDGTIWLAGDGLFRIPVQP